MNIKGKSLKNPNVTVVENELIDRFLLHANGEYVKVYIYILRHSGEEMDAGMIADAAELTDRDVRRALCYWSRLGVIEGYSEDQPGQSCDDGAGETRSAAAAEKQDVQEETGIGDRSAEDEDTGYQELAYEIANHLNNALPTHKDDSDLKYLYYNLKLPKEVIETLADVCIEMKHPDISFMKRIGEKWDKIGVKDIKGAEAEANKWKIRKALGIDSGRDLATAEEEMIHRWYEEYGFTTDIILEACNRAVRAGIKGIAYPDGTLKKWKEASVRTTEDIKKYDEERRKKYAAEQAGSKDGGRTGDGSGSDAAAAAPRHREGDQEGLIRRNTKNRFNDFAQRDDDIDAIARNRLRERLKNY